ncbi:MAG: hypothetical protein Q7R34_02505 [Dehalococcoidia bacterium]|nr:hypothetical protein [Dehalococcoidia bacterium]
MFYLAPEFYKAEELNEAYLNTNVLRKSAPFSPLDIGSLPDDGPHYVVFCASVKYAYRRSESRKLLERSHSGEDFLEHQLMRAHRDKVETNGAFFDRITRGILDVIEERQVLLQSAQATHLWEEAERRETRQEKAQFAAYLSRAYLDTELFVLSEQDN